MSETQVISGKVGAVVYCMRDGKTYKRKHVKPRQPDSLAQKRVRGFFGAAAKMANAVELKSVPSKEVKRAKNHRAGGRIKTKPTARNAVMSVLFRGGVAVERIDEKLFRAIVIDGKPHTLKVMKTDGEVIGIDIAHSDEMLSLHFDAAKLQVDNSPVQYEIERLKFLTVKQKGERR